MTEKARFSVAMATYNGGRFLRAQLESIAAQSHLPMELHVGDDGSTDDTLAILDAFAREAPFPVFVHRNPQRLGHRENFLTTTDRCAGDWIAFCDQDDVWMPGKLAACDAAIARGGADLRLIAHNAMIVDQDLTPLYLKTYWRGAVLKPRLTLPPAWMCAGFTQIFHRSLIELLPYEDGRRLRESDWVGHDSWIPILAMATGAIMLLGEPLALYRRHDANVSGLFEKEPRNRANEAVRALRDNGPIYAQQAVETKTIAGVMRAAAKITASPAAAAQLADAADKTASYARFLAARADIYERSGLRGRLRGVVGLFASGGYAGTRRCRFGPRALLKDLAFSILPRSRST